MIKNHRSFILVCVSLILSFDVLCDRRSAAQKFFIVIDSTADYASVLTGPFFEQLAQEGTLFTNYSCITHPALPNYFALTAGDTFGVTTDFPAPTIDVPNLVDLLEARGVSWKLYIENWPGNCFDGQFDSSFISFTNFSIPEFGFPSPFTPLCSAAAYVRFHNPFINFLDVSSNPVRCSKIVDAAEFFNDVKRGCVPDFAFYIPNTINGNFYIQENINPTLPSPVSYTDRMLHYLFTIPLADKKFIKDRVFAVIFDQSLTPPPAGSNQVYAVFVGSNVKKNNQVDTAYNHYSLLRTIEDNFNLGTLGRNDQAASPMVGWQVCG